MSYFDESFLEILSIMHGLLKLGIALAALNLAACSSVFELEQADLDAPGRQFGERGAFSNECNIMTQVETGRFSGSSGGGGSC